MRRGSALLVALAMAVVPFGSGHHKDRDRDDQDRSTGKNSRGKCEQADYCDDRDFSPTFDKSPVQDSFNICLPGATCHYDGKDQPPADGQQAMVLDPRCLPYHCDQPQALFPPDPKKMTELIQAFASGVGKSAGDLAGAIAAFPPALLL